MNQYTLFYPAIFLAGVLAGVLISEYRKLPVRMGTTKRIKKKQSKEAVVEKELQETEEFLMAMNDDTGDLIGLKIWKHKWPKETKRRILAIGNIKRLALTSKPHSVTEMAKVKAGMDRRPPVITGGKVLVARRRQ